MSYAYILSNAVPLASITLKAVPQTPNATNVVPLAPNTPNAVPPSSYAPKDVPLMFTTLFSETLRSNISNGVPLAYTAR